MAVSIFKDEYIVRVYQLARSGMTEAKIAKVLGISLATFRVWEKKKKYFKLMLEAGRKEANPNNKDMVTLRDYIHNRLSKNLRRIWKEIDAFGNTPSGIERLELMLQKRGIRVRQHLFIYAMTRGNYSVSYALRKVNISRSTLEAWKRKEPEFSALCDEIDWHKENFLEDSFFKLVAGGDTAATIHGVKTKLRKRGYGEKTDIDINLSGGVSVIHTVEGKGLSLETRKAILEDLRKDASKEKKTTTNKT